MSNQARQNFDLLLLTRAREMRHTPASSEHTLWQHLRDRRLGGWKFRRQHPEPPYVADFFCFDSGLIVELDGRSHEGRQEYDERRTEWIERDGLRVIRFLNEDVYSDIDAVLRTILRECERRIAEGYLPRGKGRPSP